MLDADQLLLLRELAKRPLTTALFFKKSQLPFNRFHTALLLLLASEYIAMECHVYVVTDAGRAYMTGQAYAARALLVGSLFPRWLLWVVFLLLSVGAMLIPYLIIAICKGFK